MNSPSSTNDIRGSGYSAVNALRNTNNEKSIIDPNNNNNTNRILNRENDPGQIAPNDYEPRKMQTRMGNCKIN